MDTFKIFRRKPKLQKIRQRVGIHDKSNSFADIFYTYCVYTRVNGMYYLRKEVTNGFVRILWIVLILLITAFGAVLTFLVVQAFIEIPTLMTRGTPVPTLSVPFPAITFCSANSVIDYKAKKFVNEIIVPEGSTKANVKEALLVLTAFTERQWTNLDIENVILTQNILTLNNLTILQAVEKLGLGCSDFIKRFAWGKTEYKCTDRYCIDFVQSTSHLGICCSINYRGTDRRSMFAINYFGVGSGLNIVLADYPQLSDGISGAIYSNGLMMLIHHPNDFPSETEQIMLIKPGRSNFIAVYPIITTCSSDVLKLGVSARKCIEPEDFFDQIYVRSACELECFTKRIYFICNCHPYYLPTLLNGPNIRNCTVKDAICFSKNFLKFKTSKCNLCLPACDEITYRLSLHQSDLLPNISFSILPVFSSLNVSRGEFTASIYLARQTVPVQSKILVMSWITLLENFGGIFSLSLGVSLITVIEFIFYFGSQFVQQYIRKFSWRRRQRAMIRIVRSK